MIKQLNNGVSMPFIGLGVFKVDDAESVVSYALESGYRSVDTAAYYKNEKGVGKAIRQSKIPREDIFITTKVWNDDLRNNNIHEALERSLDNLDVEYIDLYLMHWPVNIKTSWRVMEEIYNSGKVHAIGVSNFNIHHLEEIEPIIMPAVNQVELHPYYSQKELLNYCKGKGIQLQGWGSLGSAHNDLLSNALINELADKYNKTPAQIILRWNVQNDVMIIPKSVTPKRIVENFCIFDFEISDADMKLIDGLDNDGRFGPDPDNFNF